MNRPERILFVEDDPDIQAVARLALEVIGGFTVEVCPSGQVALAAAPGFAPDLIILDVMMPFMDGPTTMVALRQIPTLAQVPIVFMTAKVQPHELDHYHSLGAADVIAKPFDPLTLPKTLVHIWERSGGRPHPHPAA